MVMEGEAMKVVHWVSSEEVLDLRIADIVEYEVRHQDSERGQIEDLECQLQMLTRIVSALIEHLGEDSARAVMARAGFFYHRPHDPFK